MHILLQKSLISQTWLPFNFHRKASTKSEFFFSSVAAHFRTLSVFSQIVRVLYFRTILHLNKYCTFWHFTNYIVILLIILLFSLILFLHQKHILLLKIFFTGNLNISFKILIFIFLHFFMLLREFLCIPRCYTVILHGLFLKYL